MGIARDLAQYVKGWRFEALPPDVVHHAKRLLLDTLGCAIGGCPSDAARALEALAEELAHPGEATIFGSGLRTSCANAALTNGAMVRYLDFNDTAFIIEGETYRTGYHPSEIIPAVLAVGERQHISGQEALLAIVLGYELSMAFLRGVKGSGMEKKGWNGDTRGAYIVPLIAGRILGLTAEQMENAVGICGSCHAVFQILDNAAEEYTMTKNIRFPMMAYNGILAAMLAKKGFTGPERMIEGHDGFIQVIMNGEYDPESVKSTLGTFAVREACIKSIIADFSSHGHLTATLTLARTHDIKPEDVAEVRVTTSKRCAEHTGDPVKKYPRNKETADHSSYYLTAIAIVDRVIGPDQFVPEKYSDPRVIDLIGKVVLIGDPQLDKQRPAGVVEIITTRNERYSCRIDYPRGHAKNPMTDAEVEAKFLSLAEKHMGKEGLERIVDMVFNLEKIADIGELNRSMVFGETGK
jgi:2-methylcitrate dehydratase